MTEEKKEETRAVVDGEIQRLSASSVTKYDHEQFGGCHRKWYYHYVLNVPEPAAPAAQTGGNVHKQVEHFLKTGEDVLGDVARTLKPFMPTPKAAYIEVEHKFDGELTSRGIPWIGYIDLVDWANDRVVDWKTTSRIENAKLGCELMRTIQMPAYAKWYLDQTSKDRVHISHVYAITRGKPHAEERKATVTRDQVEKRWSEIETIVDEMITIASEPDVLKVETNLDSCTAWGGCAYKNICPRPKSSIVNNLFRGENMSLKSTILGRSKPEVKPEVLVKMEELKAQESMLTGKAAVKYAEENDVGPIPSGSGIIVGGITPPDVPKSDPALASEPLEAPVVEKVKRGRKKVAPDASQPIESLAPSGLELFVDCVGAFGPTLPLDNYIAQILEKIEGDFNVVDIRATENGALAFGKWKGVLAAYIKNEPPVGRYVLRDVRESEIRQVVCETLKPKCTVFVRGV